MPAAKKLKSIRYTSRWTVAGWPLVSIAFGPDADSGELKGVARGIIALGDYAIGFVAIGGISVGGISIGGVALGGLALGGVALGGLILGGASVGVVAAGGAAIGHYARGGAVIGNYVASPKRKDPEAVELFNKIIPGSLSPVP